MVRHTTSEYSLQGRLHSSNEWEFCTSSRARGFPRAAPPHKISLQDDETADMYDTYPADRHGVILPLKICVGITSSLSIIGGFLVVLTFCIRLCQFRATHRTDGAQVPLTDSMRLKHEMMSPGRLIVVNLSIANILLAVSHLWGVAGEYQTFFDKNDNVNNSDPNGSTNAMCNVQGALAVYGTISSFLWTIILSFFVVGTLVLPHPKRYGSPLTLLAYLIVCWGIPLVIVIVIAVKREFGLEDEMTIGECSIHAIALYYYM